MNASEKFYEDLEVGISVEKDVLSILRKKYPCATLIDGFKGYDIWIPELHKSVEVKSDQKSQHTGNIVIEIEMYDKPSGIMASTADFWIIYDGEKYMIFKRNSIINCIFQNKLQFVEFVGKGDTKPKKAFLVDKETLFKYGRIL